MRKVFIVAGQSNATGRGNLLQLDPVPAWAQVPAAGWTGAPDASSDTGVRYARPTAQTAPCLYTENLWVSPWYAPGFGSYVGSVPQPNGSRQDVGYGPEVSLYYKLRAAYPGDDLVILKCTLGGTGIEAWLPGGEMDTQWRAGVATVKAQLDAAGVPWGWAGMFWMQGENGASNVWQASNPPFYKDRLRQFLANIRAATRYDLRVAIGRISDSMLHDRIILPQTSPATDQWHPAITAEMLRAATNTRRAEQVEVAGDPNTCWWDNDGLPVLIDQAHPEWSYHFLGAGYLAMGERAAAAFLGAVPPPSPPPPVVPPPPPPAPALVVKFNGTPQPWAVKLNGVTVGAPGDTIDVTG